MSPEIVNRREYCGQAADMWALGVLLFVMTTGKYPFKGNSEYELYREISKGEFTFPLCLSRNCKQLIKRLLQVNPYIRPTCDDVLKDAFFLDNEIKLILDR